MPTVPEPVGDEYDPVGGAAGLGYAVGVHDEAVARAYQGPMVAQPRTFPGRPTAWFPVKSAC